MLLLLCIVTIGLGLVVGLFGMTIAHFRPKRRGNIEGKHVLVSENTKIYGSLISANFYIEIN
jgi:hypothetical protein